LSTISNRTQLNKLSHGLESLLLKQSDGEQQIQLLNFDQTGGVISLFNKVLQKSQKEAKILGLIQDELLDNLSKIQIATGNMNDIVVQQQKNTQKVNAEKFQLEESMANLEEILHRQNETLEVALTHTHDIASAAGKPYWKMKTSGAIPKRAIRKPKSRLPDLRCGWKKPKSFLPGHGHHRPDG
jgi:hypothetical protein